MSAGRMATGVREDRAGLRAHDIMKRYSGVTVLHGVSVAVRPGEVLGLVGHNGAGKSTLLRTMSGATVPDAGRIEVDGREVTLASPRDSLAAGIATVYQELSLLPNLTVAQNVFLGDERTAGGLLQGDAMRKEARALAADFGLEVDVDRKLGDYPVATRQLLEVAVAIHRDARYLLLDEPTTSLEGRQVENFLEVVRTLASERGMGVLMVNHKLDELYAVADRVAALVDGRLRIDARVDEVSREEVIVAIAGEEAREAAPSEQLPAASPAAAVAAGAGLRLEVRDLTGPTLTGATLTAEPGRVLGLYGLVGSGRTELLRSLVGLERLAGGTITLDGRPYRPTNPAAAQRAGVVYVTEERKQDGIVAQLDSITNVALPVLLRHRRLGLLDHRALRREAHDLTRRLQVRGDVTNPVASLSGGNQQKVLLARALAQRPRVLLLDEPTKGVDIGVKTEIHRMIRALAHEEGLTVVLVSSEEEEICEVADDIVVVSHGGTDGVRLADHERSPRDLRHAAWTAA
ncbi:sugar ABC transporter ATP-binding protein [Georgenia thermotolerans]|uniref:ATP-binding cassette domain-containing protein n=1 Tax=Georgenia thermotolerans TaxID=527326 RepID=A0A7J5UUJ2_9MICO|nr:sugar ABC transporter ATP-binding protein [Georgenia thermotolerans]KAE8765947.1 ATP-binding cassette domain-containing protein [Georgenia thermotolerans]